MFVCRDLGDRVVSSRIWSSDVDITRIKVQVSYVYLFFLIMIFIQFHCMVAGSCKPSHMCTNICLKNKNSAFVFFLIGCGYSLSLYYFPFRILHYCQHITVSSLSKLFDIHIITVVGKYLRSQRASRKFWGPWWKNASWFTSQS
jgi:hypothetical protein